MNLKTITLVVLTVLSVTLFIVLQKYTPKTLPYAERVVAEHEAAAADLHPESERPPAAEFSLLDLDGKEVRLADFRGSPVLMLFWTTW